ncbi:MAG: flagellar filament capping protein FliD [Candidatus Krumholzibacteria bacterium]|jgi:flagellar hook-associated protein 2|nr:flagellar filament capping protein FliD [Candidatus Krumholzibacteria bacterium]
MSTITFSGLATGLNTADIVDQLVALKRVPITRLQNQRQGFQNQISALATLKTKLEAFQTAAQALKSANDFASLKASSSDEDILQVTAGSDASPGTYDISVESLAQAQKTRSQGYDNTLVNVGEGDLVITVGGEEHTLTLTGTTTLAQLATRINDEIVGLSASIVFNGAESGGYHLVLTGDAGSAGAFTIDASGLSGGTAPVLTETQVAADASLVVDGLPVTASGNLLSGVISGLTLDLRTAAPGTNVRVTVGTDAEGVKDQVKAFVDSYNDVFNFLEKELKVGGKLEGNASARSLGTRLENVMSASHSGGAFSTLAQIGIERQQGTRALKFDAAKFENALSDNYAAVRDLFIERDGNIGKAALIDTAISTLTDRVDGLFKIGNDSLNRSIKNIDSTIERYERSIDNYRTTLERKFRAMESTVSLLQAQGNYLSSMVFFGSTSS